MASWGLYQPLLAVGVGDLIYFILRQFFRRSGVKDMKSWNLEFDLIRIAACVAVIFLHYSGDFLGHKIFTGGNVSCELFFMMSGYLMMPKIKAENDGMDALRFIWHKLRRIFPYFLFSAALYYLLYYGINVDQQQFSVPNEIENLVWGGLFLSETGLGTAIGATWYISAMLVGMLLLFPILSKTADNKWFSCVYAPVLASFIYAFLKARYGMLQAETYILAADAGVLVLPNLLRGLAGLMFGCFIYSMSELCKACSLQRKKIYWLKAVELLLLVLVFGGIMQWTSFSKWDFVEALCFIYILLMAASYPIEIKNAGVRRVVRYLGKLSLPMYLFQIVSAYVMRICDTYGVNSYGVRTAIFWIVLIVLSVCSTLAVDWSHRRRR